MAPEVLQELKKGSREVHLISITFEQSFNLFLVLKLTPKFTLTNRKVTKHESSIKQTLKHRNGIQKQNCCKELLSVRVPTLSQKFRGWDMARNHFAHLFPRWVPLLGAS